MSGTETEQRSELTPYLSSFGAWALAFGCAVGWGAFVMPGTTFLPLAGPLGTAVGMLVGAAVMLVIGVNYHYMMNRYPDSGGTYSYAKKVFGYDHGFMSAWFLILVYIAITWANATALPLIFRNLFGSLFQVGFHYRVAGFDVYFGEILLSLSALWLAGLLCMKGRQTAVRVQAVMAVILLGGVCVGFCAAVTEHGGNPFAILPAFAPEHTPMMAVLGIAVLAPWAFAGFESISQSVEEFRFSPKKTFRILFAAVGAGAMAYVFLSILAISVLPYGYRTWPPYLRNLENMPGLAGLPTFHAVDMLMGNPGLALLAVTVIAGVVTGLVGNYIAASRLVYAMARDEVLPVWFRKLNGAGVPGNALLFIMLFSLPIPFFGRTAISWIVDVNTIGATIAYAYTSAVAFWAARGEGNRKIQISGSFGFVISLLFFLYFMVPGISSIRTMATESYLILVGWSVLGFVFFRYIFRQDTKRRFGRSTVIWVALLFLIFFSSMMWLRQATQDTSALVLRNLSSYYAEELRDHGVSFDMMDRADAKFYLKKQMELVDSSLTGHNMLQMALILIALFIMFNIYDSMMQREKNMEIQKTAAEESSKAKSTFFFNMSHDIRTPMNAIIGYTALLKKDEELSEGARDYIAKIESSSEHLLALINDLLEMSRIENGKLELEIEESDLKKLMEDVRDLFAMQMESKGIDFTVATMRLENSTVLCDAKRLSRILLNLISNSYKFTPAHGKIRVTLSELTAKDGKGSYEFRVKDTGIGMSPEFAEKVFEVYERDRTAAGIQGTGLGMAITKSFVDLMDGHIQVESEEGKGTEFIVRIGFPIVDGSAEREHAEHQHAKRKHAERERMDFTRMRLLLVEDLEVNREIATMILKEAGFQIDTAENGKAAVERIANSEPGDYQLILMDIQMPVMNGYDAAKAIRALPDPALASIPIVAMTANAFSEDVQNAMDAGMNAHIAKPLDVPKMLETLTRVLEEV